MEIMLILVLSNKQIVENNIMNLEHTNSESKSGMTLIEVMVATVLLVMGLATFLVAFSSMQRVSVTADNRMVAMHRAREILESVMAEEYKSDALNIGMHTLSNATYTITFASGYVTTKNISVSVPWINPTGNTSHNIILNGSMALCLH